MVAAGVFRMEILAHRAAALTWCSFPLSQVQIGGIAPVAIGLWMSQIARNLTAADEGILNGKRYLIHDRDPRFTAEFLTIVGDAGVKSVKLPPHSSNWNAHAEPISTQY
jgi:hypothetical protein